MGFWKNWPQGNRPVAIYDTGIYDGPHLPLNLMQKHGFLDTDFRGHLRVGLWTESAVFSGQWRACFGLDHRMGRHPGLSAIGKK